MLDIRDPNGDYPFRSMLETARTGTAGFTEYSWSKVGQTENSPNISLVRAIPEAGLMVGTGAYTDDIINRTLGIAWRIALYVSPLLLLFVGVAFFIGHSITTRLTRMTEAMRRMAQGDYDIALPDLDRADELGEMARAVEAFKVGLRDSAQAQSAQGAEQRKAAAQARSGEMLKLAEKFESAIGGVVAAVAHSTHKLENIARSLVQEARYSGE
jgi:methyl-accepting chemotaxis protein